ncbi:hypothetical protein PENTCL1PPCAC_29359 [Pristionchus entomophagus]|uniref:Uncharacterized protein n=1 Tax=Pristionchus entomophagus TaxID=358040 RepID=A0AAV5UMS1_9BILA|nr:hypothetical protein PENTCL1PPCAC_29359 [Pristionchus entomophagus]
MKGLVSICLCSVLISLVSSTLIDARFKRQTFVYDEELKQVAQIHPGTKIIVGHAGRYAPQDWPDWYTRTMMQWEGHSRLAPFASTDPRYVPYHSGKSWNKIA